MDHGTGRHWHCPACGHVLARHGDVQHPESSAMICPQCPDHICHPSPEVLSVVLVTLFTYHQHQFHHEAGV